MIARILREGKEVGRIVADEAFAKRYCETVGCTYELEDDPAAGPEEPGIGPGPSLEERVDVLETETAAISAAIERGLSL